MKNIIAIAILFLFSSQLRAQQPAVDSMQKVLMRDSLSLNDSIIEKVILSRVNYLKNAEEVRLNQGLTTDQQNAAISALREQTNENIRALLGEEKFQRYMQLIRNRMRKRNPADTALAN